MRRGGVPTAMKPPIIRLAPSGTWATASATLIVFLITFSLEPAVHTPGASLWEESSPSAGSGRCGVHWGQPFSQQDWKDGLALSCLLGIWGSAQEKRPVLH